MKRGRCCLQLALLCSLRVQSALVSDAAALDTAVVAADAERLEYFQGAIEKPRLEFARPIEGQVLDTSELEVTTLLCYPLISLQVLLHAASAQ
jgi:hypothetical protein